MARSNRFTRVLDLVLKGETVYIKNTGISVFVYNFDWHKGTSRSQQFLVQIQFETAPSKEAIELCDHVRVRCDRHQLKNTLGNNSSSIPAGPVHVDVEAHISIDQLSDLPYETKAARTLYKKEK